MFGSVELEKFEGMSKMPQDVASAWSAVENWTGSSFTPIKFLGRQIVRGVNFWFFAEEHTITNPPERKLVVFAINGFNGKYAIIPSSIQEIKFGI